jgi:hypothetical protein
MDLDAAIRRYRENRFTDDDVTRCTGLSARAYRELIKVRAVRTEETGRGPGRVRICDATTLKRSAVRPEPIRSQLSRRWADRALHAVPYVALLGVRSVDRSFPVLSRDRSKHGTSTAP